MQWVKLERIAQCAPKTRLDGFLDTTDLVRKERRKNRHTVESIPHRIETDGFQIGAYTTSTWVGRTGLDSIIVVSSA